MESSLCVQGFLTIKVTEHGQVVWEEKKKNTVVTAGLDLQRDLLIGLGPTVNIFALGNGTASTRAIMKALENETLRRQFTRVDSQPSRVIYQLVLPTTDPPTDQVFSEAALFAGFTVSAFGGNPDIGGGTMFSRVNFTPVNKTTTNTVNFTWDVPFTTV
jgi:hypothetical protein